MISGGGSNMAALLDSMDGDHPAEPVLVLANDANAGGLRKAAERGVPTTVVDHRAYADRASFEAEMIAAIGGQTEHASRMVRFEDVNNSS